MLDADFVFYQDIGNLVSIDCRYVWYRLCALLERSLREIRCRNEDPVGVTVSQRTDKTIDLGTIDWSALTLYLHTSGHMKEISAHQLAFSINATITSLTSNADGSQSEVFQKIACKELKGARA